MKTRAEVEQLKLDWCSDPMWDIEDTEGFEDYKDELVTYSITMNTLWNNNYIASVSIKAESLGIPGNTTLAQYIINLEDRINKLEDRLFNLIDKETK